MKFPYRFIVFVGAISTLLFFPLLATAQNSPPVADAGPDQTIYLGDSVTLHGSATDPDGDPVIGWQWDLISAPAGSSPVLFDDMTSSVTLFADTLGDYVLTLVAQDFDGWGAPDAVLVTVVPNHPPTAIATATPLSGPAPLTVQFDGSGSYDPENGTLFFDWDFGDQSNGTGVVSSHEYQTSGIYVARLMVTDDHGNIDFDTVDITVTPPNAPPTVEPTATPNNGPAPIAVQFYANASDPDGDALTYLWDFGDSNSSTVADPQHVYETAGTYVAWLTVSDGANDVTASVSVAVASSPLLSTSRASVVEWTFQSGNKGTISYWGDINLPTPAADDVISFEFDGMKLFTGRFGNFEPGLQPNEHLIIKRWLLVRINLNENTIYVEKHKANIRRIDNSDGIAVELMWGAENAADSFVLSPDGPNAWTYMRD